MKCLAHAENAELHSQLLRYSSHDRGERKCTDRIVGWGDTTSYEPLNVNSKTGENVKEKQVVRDFMQRNAPTSNEKQYIFQHHFDAGYYILQYNLQHTLLFHNPPGSQYSHVNANVVNHSRFKAPQITQNDNEHQNGSDAPGITPSQIGNTYLNGVWTIAQKYHLPPPSLAQYATWWKGQENVKLEQDNKIPLLGKGLSPTGRNIPVTKCNLKFPSETTSSAQARKKALETKSTGIEDSDLARLNAKLRNDELRDASCKFFTPVLEYRLLLLKQQKDETESLNSVPSSASTFGRRRPLSGNLPKLSHEDSLLEIRSKVSLCSAKLNNVDHRPSLPQMPHFKVVSIRQMSEK